MKVGKQSFSIQQDIWLSKKTSLVQKFVYKTCVQSHIVSTHSTKKKKRKKGRLGLIMHDLYDYQRLIVHN